MNQYKLGDTVLLEFKIVGINLDRNGDVTYTLEDLDGDRTDDIPQVALIKSPSLGLTP